MVESPPSAIDLFGLRSAGERIMFLPAVWPVVMDVEQAEQHAQRVLEMVERIRAGQIREGSGCV